MEVVVVMETVPKIAKVVILMMSLPFVLLASSLKL